MKKKVFLILTISWMIFIFYMSNQPASISSSQSGGFIGMLCNIPVIGIVIKDLMKIGIAEFLIRKSAHMFLYFVLAILIYNTMNKDSGIKTYLLSLLLTALYACTDELHQLFVIGRSGELRDVLVDSTGALIGLVLIFLINKLINNKKVRSLKQC
ncbi:MAG: VanZ family protein [Paraclostridium sp.]|uniref:VanZ family protein n=1 Tax=Paraclostridium sp. TaxID=2023273 RepID=UPI003F3FB2D4